MALKAAFIGVGSIGEMAKGNGKYRAMTAASAKENIK